MAANIEYLLDLNGYTLEMGDGYFVKFDVHKVEPCQFRPHGLKYSLTLHNSASKRILGFDNAHAVKPSKGFKYSGQILPYDHRHRSASDKGVPYQFESAEKLMIDFWDSVEKVLAEVRNETN